MSKNKKLLETGFEYQIEIKDNESQKKAKETLAKLNDLEIIAKEISNNIRTKEIPKKYRDKELLDSVYNEIKLEYELLNKEYTKLNIPKSEEIENKAPRSNQKITMEDGLDIVMSRGDKNGIGALTKFLSKYMPDIRNEENIEFDDKTYEIDQMKNRIGKISEQILEDKKEYEEKLLEFSKFQQANLSQPNGITGMMKESIEGYQAEDPNWIFSDHANELYAEYFKQRKALYEGNAEEIQKIQEEEAERERLLLEHFNQVQKEALEQSQAARVASEKQKEELAAEAERQAQQQVRAEANAQFKEELRNREIEGLKEVTAVQVDTSIIQQGLALQNATLTQTIADTEGKSLKTRIQQWKEYAQKVSAISQKVSEATGLATKSLSSMFSQLSASYTQDLESINGKITALDEEKEAALERATLTQDIRAPKNCTSCISLI